MKDIKNDNVCDECDECRLCAINKEEREERGKKAVYFESELDAIKYKEAALKFGAEAKAEGKRVTVAAERLSFVLRETRSAAGVPLSYSEPDEESGEERRELKIKRITLIVGAVLFVFALVLNVPKFVKIIIYAAAYLFAGWDVLLTAGKNILKGRFLDEYFLMSIATIGAFIIGEYPEGVAVMLFYKVGEEIEELAAGKSKKSVVALTALRPESANLKLEEKIIPAAPEEIGKGEIIVVRPGERIPLDGTVRSGLSYLDTSALTGESVPVAVSEGSTALAGAINGSGLLEIEVTKEYGETAAAKIIELVRNSSANKAKAEKFISKFARYYTPSVVIAALILAFLPPIIAGGNLSLWVGRALVFLVVSCPCALVISVPLGFFGGIGGASRKGILIKGGNYLEALTRAETVVFDKTGTLTEGVFEVTSVIPAKGYEEAEVLRLAAVAESNSNHPIARAIMKKFGSDGFNVSSCEEIAGHGVKATSEGSVIVAGNQKLFERENIEYVSSEAAGSIVYVAKDGIFYGSVAVSDRLKSGAKDAILALRRAGVKNVAMLTGDNKKAAGEIASELELTAFYSELLPHQKVEKIEELNKGKGKLVFVGDGINDSPALARADVGIAMGALGSDAAIEAADVVLTDDKLSKIPEAIGIAKKTRSIVVQNIVFALAAKLVILVLGAIGIATMWAAVFGDVGVAVIAILNSARALKN